MERTDNDTVIMTVAELKDIRDRLTETLEDMERFREHSILLNEYMYKLAVAVGWVSGDRAEIDTDELIEYVVAVIHDADSQGG